MKKINIVYSGSQKDFYGKLAEELRRLLSERNVGEITVLSVNKELQNFVKEHKEEIFLLLDGSGALAKDLDDNYIFSDVENVYDWRIKNTMFLPESYKELPQMKHLLTDFNEGKQIEEFGLGKYKQGSQFCQPEEKTTKWNRRKYDVLIPYGYLEFEPRKKQLKDNHTSQMATVAKEVIKMLYAEELTYGEALRRVLNWHGVKYTMEMERALFYELRADIEFYLQTEMNNKFVKGLLEKGYHVAVTGTNWDIFAKDLTEEEQEYLHILRCKNEKEVQKAISQSRFYWEPAWEKKSGVTYNMANAMARGCLVLTSGGKNRLKSMAVEGGASTTGKKIAPLYAFVKKVLETKKLGESLSLKNVAYTTDRFAPESFVAEFLKALK